jgi:hypothetical protein
MKSTLYTLQKVRKDDSLYGPSHGSDYGGMTLCGQEIGDNWWITNNTYDGSITCKKCLKILELYPTLPQRNSIYENL